MPQIKVQIDRGESPDEDLNFTTGFLIGRDGNCQVRIIGDGSISRTHAEVVFEGEHWILRDLNSTNGTFIDGTRIDCVMIMQPLRVQLGTGKTSLRLIPERVDNPHRVFEEGASITQYIQHYFDNSQSGGAGAHTVMIRRAFEAIRSKQKRKFAVMTASALALLLFVAGYAAYLHFDAAQQQERAAAIFYAMKTVELEVAGIGQIVEESRNQQGIEVIRKYRVQRKEMEHNYDLMVEKLKVSQSKLSEPERLILRMARIFGECEITLPREFVGEVQNYIAKWQGSDRLEKAIGMARDRVYARRISEELLAQDLPPQFFYLALQESNFDVYSVGPMTYKGHAKGMWQFIPETAVKYGLRIGPLADTGRPDPADDRHNFEKSTHAAARYLRFIYSTDAQASGLLVMSSYNWGEERVVNLLRTIPANPKERNFWRLLTSYRDKIPQETYDYVYYIFSAAVIGENPKLFGFRFENPLSHLDANRRSRSAF